MENHKISFLFLYAPDLSASLSETFKDHLSSVSDPNLRLEWICYESDKDSKYTNEKAYKDLIGFDAFFLLITPKFIRLIQSSNSFWQQILMQVRKAHDEREKPLIPVLITSVEWEHTYLLEKLEPLPRSRQFIDNTPGQNRNVVLRKIAQSIHEEINHIRTYKENLENFKRNAFQLTQLEMLDDNDSIQIEYLQKDLGIKFCDAHDIRKWSEEQVAQRYSLYFEKVKNLYLEEDVLSEAARAFLIRTQKKLELRDELAEYIETLALNQLAEENERYEKDIAEQAANKNYEESFSLVAVVCTAFIVLVVIGGFFQDKKDFSPSNSRESDNVISPSSQIPQKKFESHGWMWLGNVTRPTVGQSFEYLRSTNAFSIPETYSKLLVENDMIIRSDAGINNSEEGSVNRGEKVIVLRIKYINKGSGIFGVWAEVHKCGYSCESN